jgi:hypothetical protein
MHNGTPKAVRPPGAAMTLATLQTLPCGCIAAIYRAYPTDVEVELVEAKGPHCRFFRHRAGQVISLGVPDVVDSEGTEPRV